jgi:hypothetical protein
MMIIWTSDLQSLISNFHWTVQTGRRLLLALALTLFVAGGVASAEEGQWKASTGFDYSSGDYGEDSDTKMTYVPVSISYVRGNWTGKVSTGWIKIDGPGSVIDEGVILSGNDETRQSESGIADIWASLSYAVEAFPANLGFVDLTGKVKIPMADEDKDLGTGEVDYAAQIDYLYAIGRLTPMATIGYKVKGDPPGTDLDDVLYASAGFDWRFSDVMSAGSSLDYQQASTSTSDDLMEIFNYVHYKVNDRYSVSPYLYIGLSDSSSDMGGGIQLTVKH